MVVKIECLVQVATINFKVVNLGLANLVFKEQTKFSKTKIRTMASMEVVKIKSLLSRIMGLVGEALEEE